MGQQIALPAYFEGAGPGDPVWERLAAGQGSVALAVFDDWDVLAGVKPRLRASGIQVFGYVSTHKGTLDPDVCRALIDDWFKRHADLDGIFVDEGPPLDSLHPEEMEPAWVGDYYGGHDGEGIYGYVKGKRPDARVFLNCSGCQDARILTACDIAQVVEQDCARYLSTAWWADTSAPWWTSPPVGKAVAHVVHSCPDDDGRSMRLAVGLSKRRGTAYVYVFDGSAPAYSRLPPYWDAETAAVATTPADPCEMLADVRQDVARSMDELGAEIASASAGDKPRLIQALARLTEQHAEIEVLLADCREG